MLHLPFGEFNGSPIPQRQDGYVSAKAMCRMGGRKWSEFKRLKSTEEYLGALESCLGIPRQALITSGKEIWVHPRLGLRLARWISPKFAVVVDGWVTDILSGKHPMPNEASHEGAIARNVAALIESQSMLQQSTADFHAAVQRFGLEE